MDDLQVFPEPRRKFQHRYGRHIALFVLTLVTTTIAGAPDPGPGGLWRALAEGLYYSLPILIILGCHEFGHYFYCRKHDVDATLPFFLPAPSPPLLTGTLGAVIRIKEPFPSKRALFDIGVAGPIAGFVALLPFLYWGVQWSVVGPRPINPQFMLEFGEPLLFKILSYAHFGPIPAGSEVYLHGTGFAAWFGMLATAMNLLPFGQLDGGHISYAVVGRRSWIVSLATLVITVLMVIFQSISWLSMAIIMLAMAWFLGLRHPVVVDESEPLDPARKAIAFAALVIFVLCFTPVPIQTFFK